MLQAGDHVRLRHFGCGAATAGAWPGVAGLAAGCRCTGPQAQRAAPALRPPRACLGRCTRPARRCRPAAGVPQRHETHVHQPHQQRAEQQVPQHATRCRRTSATLRSSGSGGCHCWRHSVAKACQRVSSPSRRGGTASGRCRKHRRRSPALVAPVIAPDRARASDSNQLCQPGGNSPAARRRCGEPQQQPSLQGKDQIGGGRTSAPPGPCQAASRGGCRARRPYRGRWRHAPRSRRAPSPAGSSRCPASGSHRPCRNRGSHRRSAAPPRHRRSLPAPRHGRDAGKLRD